MLFFVQRLCAPTQEEGNPLYHAPMDPQPWNSSWSSGEAACQPFHSMGVESMYCKICLEQCCFSFKQSFLIIIGGSRCQTQQCSLYVFLGSSTGLCPVSRHRLRQAAACSTEKPSQCRGGAQVQVQEDRSSESGTLVMHSSWLRDSFGKQSLLNCWTISNALGEQAFIYKRI